MATWRELQEENKNKQAGVDEQIADRATDFGAIYASRAKAGTFNTMQSLVSPAVAPNGFDATDEMVNSSFGESKYDNIFFSGMDEDDINQQRAENQSNIEKIGAGLGKMAILTATTFADGLIGTLAGIANMQNYASTYAGTDDFSWRDFGYSFIDNEISNGLQKINEESEKWMPNYYTQQEKENRESGQWYKNINTANFWADTILKNTGFALGAGLSMAVAGGGISNLFKVQNYRNVFKGLVNKAAKASYENVDDIFKAIMKGDLKITQEMLTEELKKSARQLAAAELKTMWASGTVAAIGEGRMEAINNTKDWYETNASIIDGQAQQELNGLLDVIANERQDLFEYKNIAEASGGEFLKLVPREDKLDELSAEIERRSNDIKAIREERLAALNKNRATVANFDFIANLPILTVGNVVQAGRFVARGFKTGKYIADVTGDLGAMSASKGILAKNIAKSIGKTAWEGLGEEMLQQSAAYGSGYYGARNLLDFYRDALDPEANRKGSNWINAILNGVVDTYIDPAQYEQAFAGIFTAALGLPGFKTKTNSKTGKSYNGLTWNNELVSGIKESIGNYKDAKTLANELNTMWKDPERVARYQNFIANIKNEKDKVNAIFANDAFNFELAENKQFVHDAILMARAGKIEEFKDEILKMSNLSDEDLNLIKEKTVIKGTNKSIFDGMSDDQIRQQIKDNAELYSNQIKSFEEVSNNLKTLYGEKLSDDVMSELTWRMFQVDHWRNSANESFDAVVEELQKSISVLEERIGHPVDFLHGTYQELLDNFTKDSNLLEKIAELSDKPNMEVSEKIKAIHREIDKATDNSSKKEAKIKNLEAKREKLTQQIDKASERAKKAKSKESAEKYDAQMARKTAERQKVDQQIEALNKEKTSVAEQIVSLRNELDNTNYIPPIKLNEIREHLDNIVRSVSKMARFMEDYKTLSLNPDKFTKEAVKQREEIIKEENKKKSSAKIAKLDACDTFQKFADEISESVEGLEEDDLYNAIRKSGSERTKQFLEDYIKIMDTTDIIVKILSKEKDKSFVESMSNIINDAIANATSYEDYMKTLKDVSVIKDEELAKKITSLMETVDEHLASNETTKSDEKESSEPVAPAETKKEGGLNLENFFTSEDEQSQEDAEMDDDVEEDNQQQEEDEKQPIPQSQPTEEAPIENPVEVEVPVASPEEVDTETGEVIEERHLDYEALAEELKKQTDQELKDLINCKEYPPLTQDELKAVQMMAQLELNSRKPAIEEGASEEQESEQTNEEQKNVDERTEEGKPTAKPAEVEANGNVEFDGMAETEYDYTELNTSRGGSGKAVVRTGSTIVEELRKVGAYTYVDKGMLADKLAKDPDARVHVLYMPDGSGIRRLPVLAVEIKPGEKAVQTINGHNGKKYQIIGVLRNSSNNKDIADQYTAILNKAREEYQSDRNRAKGDMFVSSIKMKVSFIGGGQMVKAADGVKEKASDRLDVTNEWIGNNKVGIAVVYSDSNVAVARVDGVIQMPNLNNANSRGGSVYLYVKTGDGHYYPRAVRVKRFTQEEYPIERYKDTPIFKNIVNCVRIILDPSSNDARRNTAKGVLSTLLYIPDGKQILFNKKGDKVDFTISNFNGDKSVVDGATDLQDAINKAVTALMDKQNNFRFQIAEFNISDMDLLDEIFESGVLDTDLALPYNVVTGFKVKLDTDGVNEPVKFTPFSREFDVSKHTETVQVGAERYSVDTENHVFDRNGNQVTGRQQAEVLARKAIKDGTVKPVDGNNTLYLFNYPNGEEFAIIRGTVFNNSEEIENLKQRAQTRKEKLDAAKKREETSKAEAPIVQEQVQPVETEQGSKESAMAELDKISEDASGQQPEVQEKPAKQDKTKPAKVSLSNIGKKRTITPRAKTLSLISTDAAKSLGYKNQIALVDAIEKSDKVDLENLQTKEAVDALIENLKNGCIKL